MFGAHARVHHIDQATSDRIAAAYSVPSVEVAVQEAIYNAIDAHAKHITAKIDLSKGSFEISDDGDGIDPDALFEHVFEAAVSSHQTNGPYGKHGQFLVCLATIAREVDVESRIHGERTSYRKTVHESRVLFNARSKISRTSKGTTLRGSNLFWQLPVRQRELESNPSTRSKIARRLSAFFRSLSMIWPSLSIDASYADDKVPRCCIQGVSSCEARLIAVFGDILAKDLEYVAFESPTTPYAVRGYVGIIHDGSDDCAGLDSPGWRQAQAYYQFVFLDNVWIEDFHRQCCKTINIHANRRQLGIPLFVLKVSAKSHEYDLHSDGGARAVHFRHPEQVTIMLREFVEYLAEKYRPDESSAQPPDVLKVESEIEQSTGRQRDESAQYYAYDQCDRDQVEMASEDDMVFYYDEHRSGLSLAEGGADVKYGGEYQGPVCQGPIYGGEDLMPIVYVAHDEDGYFDYDPTFDQRIYDDSSYPWYESTGDNTGDTVSYDQAYSTGCVECRSCGSHVQLGSLFDDPRAEEDVTYHQEPRPELVEYRQAMMQEIDWRPHEDTQAHDAHVEWLDERQESHPPLVHPAEPTPASKQESAFDQLFFGHRPLPKSSRQRPVEKPIRKTLQGEDMQEDAWVCSRRVGTARRQLCLSGNQPSDENAVAPTPKEEEHAVGSRLVSDYFSIDRLVEKHARASRLPVQAWAAKRIAVTVDPSDAPQTAVYVGDLPRSLHHGRGKAMAVDRSVFEHLHVIKQVDRKFILVKVESSAADSENTLLLCIDQHAADERVRLEHLEAQVFGPNGDQRNVETAEHDPPIPVRLNASEVETLQFFHDEIESWGFEATIVDEPSGYVTLHRTLRVERRVATANDFREYLQLLARSDSSVGRRVLRPPVLTRFLHSRACRSAIMFGDYLSVSQCRDLMEQLRTCRLPFQCAHGRPSIVPLVELQSRQETNE